MTKDEALKLALEALEQYAEYEGETRAANEAITAIKEALAQPEQGPVGSVVRWVDGSLIHGWFGDPPPEGTLLYITSPVPVQPEREPVDFVSLLREAEEIVQSKPTWKRFIDGTPLANDIAVWMAVFAQDVARRTTPPPQGNT